MALSLAVPLAVPLVASAATAASIVGYHDSSDPLKTLGWVCSTGDARPVTVSMFARTAQGMQLVATGVADKRRDDLGTTCPGGTAHAFRFSDYAASGADVYSEKGPVPIYVFADTENGLAQLPGSPRSVSFAPVGIWDAGLVSGRWRTDQDNPLEGTAAAPLLLGDCGDLPSTAAAASPSNAPAPTGCRYGNVVSPASNASTSGSTWPMDRFWALIANVENSFDNPDCVDGPPGQSRSVERPGAGGLFGVLALPDLESGDGSHRKMHLVLNSAGMADCRDRSYGIPHLSFGAQADRGNSGIITYLNRPGAPTMLRFGMTLMDIADRRPDAFEQPPAGDTRSSQAEFVVEATWGGTKRWLIVEVLPDPHVDAALGGNVDLRVAFTWPLVDSFLYPGADYAFKSSSVLSTQCAAEGVSVPTLNRKSTYFDPATRADSRREFAVDLQKAFDCLQRLGTWGGEPMPSHPIPVTGIHFGIGQDDVFYRDGVATPIRSANAIWIAVDGVRVE